MATNWIDIDGSEGEGGGQMLRSSLALSVLTGKPVRLTNIRAKRSKPGLQAQHLASVQAAAMICQANVGGDQLGSQQVSFRPGPVQSGKYFFKIGTAGATALVLHTVYLPLLLKGQGPSSIRIEGGTHALAAPSGEYLTITWAGYLQTLGAQIEVKINKPGFFPKGGGLLQADITPCRSLTSLSAADALATNTGRVECLAIVGSKLPISIGERIVKESITRLGTGCTGRIIEYPHAKSPGVVATIIDYRGAVPSVFYGLGARGKPSEAVCAEAIDAYLTHRETGCPIDPHAADQILLPLVFAAGSSAYRTSAITQHLLTQRDIIKRFDARDIEIAGELGQPGEVKISL
ncbi:MAG TPA: RNA 3'-terminal phosphate cyclase [Gemmatales bacterium]|nr:RNA 3'-terminal phosphate cyclase [Gemmatales bacterium]